METKNLHALYSVHPHFKSLVGQLKRYPCPKINLTGLHGSSKSILCARYILQSKRRNLIILTDKEEAAYFYNDLTTLVKNNPILFFPTSYKRSVQYQQPDHSNIILRTEILNNLISKNDDLTIVTYPEALIEKIIDRENLNQQAFHIGKGKRYTIEEIRVKLRGMGFEEVDFIFEPGQFSNRGSILDVFSYSNDHPFRIDFFGNEIDSIRSFDVESQLSRDHLDKITVLPDIHDMNRNKLSESFLSFFPGSTVIWSTDFRFMKDRINEVYHQTHLGKDEKAVRKEDVLINGDLLAEHIRSFPAVEFGQNPYFTPDLILEFRTSSQPVFNKNFEFLTRNLNENSVLGYKNLILSESEKQFERLSGIFNDINRNVQFIPLRFVLHQGFIEHDLKICCYTDHQIFERYHKFRLRGNFSRKEAISPKELNSLNPGDYVVHIDHGTGQFGGLERIEINGKFQEAIKLVYKDQDVLYVRLHALHRISKYKGKDSTPPKIYKLGSGAWNKLKQTTKRRVKDIAKELISLYAKRKTHQGFAFSPDSYLQDELEASFLYEDTVDQLAATKAVKEGMESPYPMDRLVCGDVGFGKTEVAVRAAFKAVADSKQVGLLAPTTVLVLQHYNTFCERLKDLPCNIDYISRLKKPSAQKITLQKLSEGKTDIIIGTHRMLGKDIRFKDIGLLIIDEEQKFGVAAKEKIRKFKLNIDTLTLTATPIPRTLQFSLMGARDLSIINTPPPNRHPIFTELHSFNENLIKEGIEYEVSRSGQVFFIHNRVENIHEIESLINRICPSVKAVVAHGQLDGRKLENTMMDFIHGDFDVLVATTIIESGLDIPNANTIFINNAHHFGLSDLHQLRGRVGRSNKKAFCYLLAPPLTTVTPEARRRLKAIEEYSDLGSGFNIAMQDLDIRGAGNLLGGEQSGFIADIGFETYQRILDEAIRELKEEEFREFFRKEENQTQSALRINEELGKILFIQDCTIDTDLELMFPETYISNVSERFRLYRDLDNIRTEGNLHIFENQLIDRFGPIPETARDLLNLIRLRWIAVRMGFEKIVIRSNKMILHFISDQTSPYFRSPVFSGIICYIQVSPKMFRMKESRGKLTLQIEGITNVRTAREMLTMIETHSIPKGKI